MPATPPGEPPAQPLPSTAAPPPPPDKKLTAQQVMLAKLMGLDLSDVYEYQHAEDLAFKETAARERAKKVRRDLEQMREDEAKEQSLSADINGLESLLMGFSGGGLTHMAIKLSELGTSLGLTLDPRLSDKQQARALINQITLKLKDAMGGMPGQLSDHDIKFLKGMAPDWTLPKRPAAVPLKGYV